MDFAALDLARLATLRAVAETGSFTAAAERLHLTQPAVSQQIGWLERRFGVPLLHRKPVAPTVAGQTVLTHLDDLARGVAALTADLDALRGLRRGTARIGAFLSACRTFVPPALGALQREHPGLRAVLRQGEPDEVIAALAAGALDCAIVFHYSGENAVGAGFRSAVLVEEPVLIAVPPGHPLAGRSRVSLRSVDTDDLLHAPSACVPEVAARIQTANATYLGDDFGVALAMVAAGMGTALLPALAARDVPAGVVLRPVTGASRRTVSALWPRTGVPDPLLDALLPLLAEHAKGLTPASRAGGDHDGHAGRDH